ncbi:zinc-binding dehydrogenase [Streptomyces sp. NPDC002215]|uniref:zinc-binding dehydrogenase n=1 Tax=Streptomyces sp. NPDC002215 TaxID=3154412 RepID=UPI00333451A2
MTASHLSTGTYPIGPGDTAVVHAAAGGVGLLLTQMVKAHGGRVIGLVPREGKVPVAKEVGADHVLVHSGGGFEERNRKLTGEREADVFCDGSGTGMFHFSQPALRPHGVHAYYGPFTAAPTLLPTDLPDSSLLTYPVVHHHVATREALLRRTGEVFGLVLDGRLAPRVTGRCAPASMPSWTEALPLTTLAGCVTPPVAIRIARRDRGTARSLPTVVRPGMAGSVSGLFPRPALCGRLWRPRTTARPAERSM